MKFNINNLDALGEAAATWNTEHSEPGTTQAGAVINIELADGTEIVLTYDPNATTAQ